MTGKEYHSLLELAQKFDVYAKTCDENSKKATESEDKHFWLGKKNGIEVAAEELRGKLRFMNS